MKQQSKQLSVPAAPIHSYPILYLNFSIIYFTFYWKQLSFQYNKRCEGEWFRKKADANSGLSRYKLWWYMFYLLRHWKLIELAMFFLFLTLVDKSK